MRQRCAAWVLFGELLLSEEKTIREQEDERNDAGATHGSTPDSQAGIRVLPSYRWCNSVAAEITNQFGIPSLPVKSVPKG